MRKIILATFFLASALLVAKDSSQKLTKKTAIVSHNYFDINRITCPVQNNGCFARHPINGSNDFLFDGVYYIYASGIWLAAKVNGTVRASAADFCTDFVGGAIDASGIPFGKNDSTFRVYKISAGDNAANNVDYAQWPGWLGAPLNELGDPRLLGDQTLWTSFTDAFVEERIEYNICPPLGAEIHLTAWGWETIDDLMFLRWKIINKSSDVWEDAYLGVWSDPDVFDANDDLTGSDSTLNLVYCFDKERWNGEVKNCIGYALLETPTIPSPGDTAVVFGGELPGFRNAPVYSPLILKHGRDGWGEMKYLSAETAQWIYNRLQALNYFGDSMIDPVTGSVSHWAYSGDPILESGWLDPLPSDRRMILSTGPVTISPGDTGAVTLVVLPVQQVSSKAAIWDLKQRLPAIEALFTDNIGIYAETVSEIVGAKKITVPISCMNNQNFDRIEFAVSSTSSALQLMDIFPAERITDFSVEKNIDSVSNTIQVVLEKTGAGLTVGKGALANLIVNVADTVDSNFADYLIKNIICQGDDGREHFLKFVKGTILIEDLPEKPRLLEPAQNSRIESLTINFSWSPSGGSNGNVYLLDFLGTGNRDKVTQDSSIKISTRDFVLEDNYENEIDWTIKIMNYSSYPICSADTFRFLLPQAEEIRPGEPFQTVTLERTENYFYMINNFDFCDPCLYLLVTRSKSDPYEETDWLFVVDLAGEPLIVNQQQLPITEDGFIKVFGERVIIYNDYNIQLYTLNESRQIEFKSEKNVISFVRNVIMRQNTLYVDCRRKIYIFQIDDQDVLNELVSCDLSDWPIAKEISPSFRYKSSFDLDGNFLFVAKNDLGIFDVSQPDSIRLISRTDVPGEATTVDYEAEKVYLGNNQDWIGIYDVSSKEHPQEIYSEQFVDAGGDYEKIGMLKVINGYIFFSNLFEPGLLGCHYLSGESFNLDLAVEFGNEFMVSRYYIYALEWNTINIYPNWLTSEVAENPEITKKDFQLWQNFPNPFNPATEIRYQISASAHVRLEIYNLLGQKIITIINKQQPAGSYATVWDGKNLYGEPAASGIYLYRLKAGDFCETKKMILLR